MEIQDISPFIGAFSANVVGVFCQRIVISNTNLCYFDAIEC